MNETQQRAIEHADYIFKNTLPISSIPKKDPEKIRQAIINLIRNGIAPATIVKELIHWPDDCGNITKELVTQSLIEKGWKVIKDTCPRSFCPTCETEVELDDREGENEIESPIDGEIYCSTKCLNVAIKMEMENGRANSELAAENAWLQHAEDNPSLGN